MTSDYDIWKWDNLPTCYHEESLKDLNSLDIYWKIIDDIVYISSMNQLYDCIQKISLDYYEF